MSIVETVLDISHFPQGLSSLCSRVLGRLNSAPLVKIKSAGIWRDRNYYFLNISYPSMQAMRLVNPQTVLSAGKQTGKEIALYIHIPFCAAECYYCHYYKKFAQSSTAVDTYLAGVLRELAMYEEQFGGLLAKSVYIGGGTPSYLTVAQIEKLFTGMREHVTLLPGAEISFEVHPESGTVTKLDALHRHGVNRINIGVESFDDESLKSENRRHTGRDAIQLFSTVSAMGFENVNLDLIYGLRGQSLQSWENNLEEVARLRPSSATMYFLRLKRGTPEYKLWKSKPDTFPTDAELLLMHAMNFERMEADLGYVQSPVDWFIRDARYFHQYQDHNWRRSDEVELLGIGVSSYSYLNGWQFYNVNDTERYLRSISMGQFPVWKGEYLEADEKMRRTLMLGLKMGIERQGFRDTYGIDVLNLCTPVWERLINLDLVEIDPKAVTLTYAGRLFADEVGQQFYSDTMKRRMAGIDPELVSTTWPQFNP
jgi:oxygen-independent coproporphyrinogen III oxidase